MRMSDPLVTSRRHRVTATVTNFLLVIPHGDAVYNGVLDEDRHMFACHKADQHMHHSRCLNRRAFIPTTALKLWVREVSLNCLLVHFSRYRPHDHDIDNDNNNDEIDHDGDNELAPHVPPWADDHHRRNNRLARRGNQDASRDRGGDEEEDEEVRCGRRGECNDHRRSTNNSTAGASLRRGASSVRRRGRSSNRHGTPLLPPFPFPPRSLTSPPRGNDTEATRQHGGRRTRIHRSHTNDSPAAGRREWGGGGHVSYDEDDVVTLTGRAIAEDGCLYLTNGTVLELSPAGLTSLLVGKTQILGGVGTLSSDAAAEELSRVYDKVAVTRVTVPFRLERRRRREQHAVAGTRVGALVDVSDPHVHLSSAVVSHLEGLAREVASRPLTGYFHNRRALAAHMPLGALHAAGHPPPPPRGRADVDVSGGAAATAGGGSGAEGQSADNGSPGRDETAQHRHRHVTSAGNPSSSSSSSNSSNSSSGHRRYRHDANPVKDSDENSLVGMHTPAPLDNAAGQSRTANRRIDNRTSSHGRSPSRATRRMARHMSSWDESMSSVNHCASSRNKMANEEEEEEEEEEEDGTDSPNNTSTLPSEHDTHRLDAHGNGGRGGMARAEKSTGGGHVAARSSARAPGRTLLQHVSFDIVTRVSAGEVALYAFAVEEPTMSIPSSSSSASAASSPPAPPRVMFHRSLGPTGNASLSSAANELTPPRSFRRIASSRSFRSHRHAHRSDHHRRGGLREGGGGGGGGGECGDASNAYFSASSDDATEDGNSRPQSRSRGSANSRSSSCSRSSSISRSRRRSPCTSSPSGSEEEDEPNGLVDRVGGGGSAREPHDNPGADVGLTEMTPMPNSSLSSPLRVLRAVQQSPLSLPRRHVVTIPLPRVQLQMYAGQTRSSRHVSGESSRTDRHRYDGSDHASSTDNSPSASSRNNNNNNNNSSSSSSSRGLSEPLYSTGGDHPDAGTKDPNGAECDTQLVLRGEIRVGVIELEPAVRVMTQEVTRARTLHRAWQHISHAAVVSLLQDVERRARKMRVRLPGAWRDGLVAMPRAYAAVLSKERIRRVIHLHRSCPPRPDVSHSARATSSSARRSQTDADTATAPTDVTHTSDTHHSRTISSNAYRDNNNNNNNNNNNKNNNNMVCREGLASAAVVSSPINRVRHTTTVHLSLTDFTLLLRAEAATSTTLTLFLDREGGSVDAIFTQQTKHPEDADDDGMDQAADKTSSHCSGRTTGGPRSGANMSTSRMRGRPGSGCILAAQPERHFIFHVNRFCAECQTKLEVKSFEMLLPRAELSFSVRRGTIGHVVAVALVFPFESDNNKPNMTLRTQHMVQLFTIIETWRRTARNVMDGAQSLLIHGYRGAAREQQQQQQQEEEEQEENTDCATRDGGKTGYSAKRAHDRWRRGGDSLRRRHTTAHDPAKRGGLTGKNSHSTGAMHRDSNRAKDSAKQTADGGRQDVSSTDGAGNGERRATSHRSSNNHSTVSTDHRTTHPAATASKPIVYWLVTVELSHGVGYVDLGLGNSYQLHFHSGRLGCEVKRTPGGSEACLSLLRIADVRVYSDGVLSGTVRLREAMMRGFIFVNRDTAASAVAGSGEFARSPDGRTFRVALVVRGLAVMFKERQLNDVFECGVDDLTGHAMDGIDAEGYSSVEVDVSLARGTLGVTPNTMPVFLAAVMSVGSIVAEQHRAAKMKLHSATETSSPFQSNLRANRNDNCSGNNDANKYHVNKTKTVHGRKASQSVPYTLRSVSRSTELRSVQPPRTHHADPNANTTLEHNNTTDDHASHSDPPCIPFMGNVLYRIPCGQIRVSLLDTTILLGATTSSENSRDCVVLSVGKARLLFVECSCDDYTAVRRALILETSNIEFYRPGPSRVVVLGFRGVNTFEFVTRQVLGTAEVGFVMSLQQTRPWTGNPRFKDFEDIIELVRSFTRQENACVLQQLGKLSSDSAATACDGDRAKAGAISSLSNSAALPKAPAKTKFTSSANSDSINDDTGHGNTSGATNVILPNRAHSDSATALFTRAETEEHAERGGEAAAAPAELSRWGAPVANTKRRSGSAAGGAKELLTAAARIATAPFHRGESPHSPSLSKASSTHDSDSVHNKHSSDDNDKNNHDGLDDRAVNERLRCTAQTVARDGRHLRATRSSQFSPQLRFGGDVSVNTEVILSWIGITERMLPSVINVRLCDTCEGWLDVVARMASERVYVDEEDGV